jgi:hypothetical protein
MGSNDLQNAILKESDQYVYGFIGLHFDLVS